MGGVSLISTGDIFFYTCFVVFFLGGGYKSLKSPILTPTFLPHCISFFPQGGETPQFQLHFLFSGDGSSSSLFWQLGTA